MALTGWSPPPGRLLLSLWYLVRASDRPRMLPTVLPSLEASKA